jgi:hypothetical protein
MNTKKEKTKIGVILILDSSITSSNLIEYSNQILNLLIKFYNQQEEIELIYNTLLLSSTSSDLTCLTTTTSTTELINNLLIQLDNNNLLDNNNNNSIWRSNYNLNLSIQLAIKHLDKFINSHLFIISNHDLELNHDLFNHDDDNIKLNSNILLSIISTNSTPNLINLFNSNSQIHHHQTTSSSNYQSQSQLLNLINLDHTYHLTGFNNSTKRSINVQDVANTTTTTAAKRSKPNTITNTTTNQLPLNNYPAHFMQPSPINPSVPDNNNNTLFDPTLGITSAAAPFQMSATSFAEIQAALAGYPGVPRPAASPLPTAPSQSPSFPTPSLSLQSQQLSQQLTQQQLQQQQQQQVLPSSIPLQQRQQQQQQQQQRSGPAMQVSQLTPAQLQSLPQLSPETMNKIRELLALCKSRLAKGEVTQEQSAKEVGNLKDTMNG